MCDNHDLRMRLSGKNKENLGDRNNTSLLQSSGCQKPDNQREPAKKLRQEQRQEQAPQQPSTQQAAHSTVNTSSHNAAHSTAQNTTHSTAQNATHNITHSSAQNGTHNITHSTAQQPLDSTDINSKNFEISSIAHRSVSQKPAASQNLNRSVDCASLLQNLNTKNSLEETAENGKSVLSALISFALKEAASGTPFFRLGFSFKLSPWTPTPLSRTHIPPALTAPPPRKSSVARLVSSRSAVGEVGRCRPADK